MGGSGREAEKNETIVAAAIREVEEETGYDISKASIRDFGMVYIKEPSKHLIYHMVGCKLPGNPGDVRIHFSEHKGFTWVTPRNALSMDLMLDEDVCIKWVYKIED